MVMFHSYVSLPEGIPNMRTMYNIYLPTKLGDKNGGHVGKQIFQHHGAGIWVWDEHIQKKWG